MCSAALNAPDKRNGTVLTSDAVLSNYGRAYDDQTVGTPNTTYEGFGTPGNSKEPARMLQFRHVMTQLNIKIELWAGDPPTEMPKTVEFTMNDVVQGGRYRIDAIDPQHVGAGVVEVASVSNTALFKLTPGTNYLVPTGEDLMGKTLKTLTIDDYKATAADLLEYVIKPDADGPNEGDSFKLYPGYAYNLTLKIGRLGLQGIKLQQTKWKTENVDGDLSFEPKVLKMDLGSYDAVSADALKNRDNIERVVLHSQENGELKRYTGEGKVVDGNVEVHFVKLPPVHQDVDSISIHTPKGLLLHFDHDPSNTAEYDPAGKSISLSLSKGGMRLQKEGEAMGPDNPYLVSTPLQFMNIQKDLDAAGQSDVFLKQIEDIDFDILNLIGSERYFIGFNEFRGVYDGGRHYVAGLDLEAPGLFEINRGTIKNLHLVTGVIKAFTSAYDNNGVDGGDYAGAICAINKGTVIGCINEVRINNSEKQGDGTVVCMQGIVGGICGMNDVGGRVIACLNAGTIHYGEEIGGIVGRNMNPNANSVVACVNIGNIQHHSAELMWVGGIAGTSVGSPNSTDPVFNTGYWLVGTAQDKPGEAEAAVDAQYLPNEVPPYLSGFAPGWINLCEDLDPEEMRSAPIRDNLNNVLNDAGVVGTEWAGKYEFLLLPDETGTTWPTPVKK